MSSTPKRMARIAVAAALAALVPLTVSGQQAGYPGGAQYPFGTPATKAEIEAWDKDVRPDGMGLPAGSGTYKAGAQLYGEQCASCHGDKLQGIRDPNLPQGGGPALIGGRGTLNTPNFKITVESYWPYATTLYDYVCPRCRTPRRARSNRTKSIRWWPSFLARATSSTRKR